MSTLESTTPSQPPYDAACRLAAERLIQLALSEDLGEAGDVTTTSLVDPADLGHVQIVSRADGVLSGGPVARRVFEVLDPKVQFELRVADGAALSRGTVVADLRGPQSALLIGERTALNFLTHLCGIASLTRRFVDAIAGTKAKIFDTRKTHPGWRRLEKYAVLCGGGANHRIGLFDMVLIKDNHLAGWLAADRSRTLADAVRAARARVPAIPIEVEVDSLDQFRQVIGAAPDIVLLDNMSTAQLREAVAIRNAQAPQIELEASGGVALGTVRAIAETGVERISAGALTHSAVALDLGFDWAE